MIVTSANLDREGIEMHLQIQEVTGLAVLSLRDAQAVRDEEFLMYLSPANLAVLRGLVNRPEVEAFLSDIVGDEARL